jgi:hypothetical protein
MGAAQAILEGCYRHSIDWDEFPYVWTTYYFFPRGLLTKQQQEQWYEDEEHCLSTHHAYNTKKECIDHVWTWARERGIKVTKREIAKAFTDHSVG